MPDYESLKHAQQLGEVLGRLAGLDEHLKSIKERVEAVERHLTLRQDDRDERLVTAVGDFRREIESLRKNEMRSLMQSINSKATKAEVKTIEETVKEVVVVTDKLRTFSIQLWTAVILISAIAPMIFSWLWNRVVEPAITTPTRTSAPRVSGPSQTQDEPKEPK